MFGFLIKKNFFDGWDNMLYIIVPNLVMIGILSVFVFGAHNVIDASGILAFFLLFLGFMFTTIATFAFGDSAVRISNYKGVTVKDYFKGFKGAIKDGILFSLLIAFIVLLLNTAIPFYVSMSNTIGLLLAALVLWLVILSVLALQWFFPIRSIMHNGFFKCLKKSFMLFFDNPLFTIGLLLYDIVLAILSIPVFLIVPSFAGIALAQVNAVRLRLYKYDYIEAHPGLSRKDRRNIPWKELLEEDKKGLGNRSLKSFIFPGKY